MKILNIEFDKFNLNVRDKNYDLMCDSDEYNEDNIDEFLDIELHRYLYYFLEKIISNYNIQGVFPKEVVNQSN